VRGFGRWCSARSLKFWIFGCHDRLAPRPAMLTHCQRLHNRRIRQKPRELDSASHQDRECPGSDSSSDIRNCYACNEMTRGAVFQLTLLVALFRCSRDPVGRLVGAKRRLERKAVPLGLSQAIFGGGIPACLNTIGKSGSYFRPVPECPSWLPRYVIGTSTEPSILGLAAVTQGRHAFDFVENIDEIF